MGWTPQQEAAINARGASVVVSAAAGSGKTSVLVERLTVMLSEPEYPAEKMVVVTFTNDAAGEVRARLNRALAKRITEEPENDWLRRQMTMLQSANISTIHSYCIRLLREQFAQLDISANFRIMDETESKELYAKCAAELLEECSRRAAEDPDAAAQQKLLYDAFCGHDDSALESLLLSLRALTDDYPFGETLLSEAAERCAGDAMVQDILSMLGRELAEIAALYPHAVTLAETMSSDKTVLLLKEEYNQLSSLANEIAALGAKAAADAMQNVRFGAMRSLPRSGWEEEKSAVRSLRSFAKDRFEDLRKTWMTPLRFAKSDLPRHAALLRALAELVDALNARSMLEKRTRNGLTFNDAIRMTLSLLAKREPDGRIVKTPLAEQLSQQYCCIMIDEFQDADNQQDLIFRMLSHGGDAGHYGDNLFVVGDSKQCIYRFRNANPENFYRAMREGAPYHSPQLTENTCILLNRNFRSGQEVVDVINHIFGMLMTEGVGEVTYDASQALVRGAEYPEGRRLAEVILIPQAPDSDSYEPAVIAERIRTHLEKGTPVTDKDGSTRPCQPRDFLILMRTGTHMQEVADAVAAAGIPVCSIEKEDYLKSPEMLLLLDILRLIDNPLPEVPAAAAMLSPLFGFTVDELIAVRLYRKHFRLYQSMLEIRKAIEAGQALPEHIPADKVLALLRFLDEMQLCAAMDTPEQLIRRIFRSTDFLGLMQMTAGGAQKKANLRALTAYAHTFEENRGGGLSAFLRWLDAVLARRDDLTAGSIPAGTENLVQIKTIHKSKGLEAPFVILAGADQPFSSKDASAVYQYHPKIGLGFQLRDPETFSKGKSLPWTAVYQQIRRETISEELRLLYVALTRAREYLILPVSYTEGHRKDAFVMLTDVQKVCGQSDSLTRAAGCYADWLVTALARSPACEAMRRILQLPCGSDSAQPFLPAAVWEENDPPAHDNAKDEPQEPAADPALTAQLAAQCSWQYQSRLAELTAKYGVSEISKSEENKVHLDRPRFETDANGLTGSEFGTAVHTFMQYADFEAAAEDLPAEIERCHTGGRLTGRQAEAVRRSRIAAFFTSPLYARLKQAKRIWREQKFMVRIADLSLDGPLAEIGAQYAGTDGMVTGIMDLVFEEEDGIVLVDYKTDSGKDEAALLEAYTEQVRLYAKALGLLMKKPVRDCCLYSVRHCKVIPVEV